MAYASKVTMRYEGDRNKPETLVCVYSWRGSEWRVPYVQIRELAQLYDLPDQVREQILFWAKMLNDPD